MTLIDDTYFWGGLTLGLSGEAQQLATLNRYIAQYEKEYLISVLGLDLYNAYIATPAATRFTDLLNGKAYSYEGKNYMWQGLVSSTMKTSPIANYVYCKVVKDATTSMTTIGVVSANAENATKASPVDKVVFSWQNMVATNRQLYDFLQRNAATYPEWEDSIWWLNYDHYHGSTYGAKLNPMFNPNGAGTRVF